MLRPATPKSATSYVETSKATDEPQEKSRRNAPTNPFNERTSAAPAPVTGRGLGGFVRNKLAIRPESAAEND